MYRSSSRNPFERGKYNHGSGRDRRRQEKASRRETLDYQIWIASGKEEIQAGKKNRHGSKLCCARNILRADFGGERVRCQRGCLATSVRLTKSLQATLVQEQIIILKMVRSGSWKIKRKEALSACQRNSDGASSISRTVPTTSMARDRARKS